MKHDDLLRTARERMSLAADADRENREMALSDLRMIAGLDHWDPKVEEQRKNDNRPCLTINRLPQFVRQVTGDLRAMNPAINVMAGDNAASAEVAEVYEGLIRHIQYRCDASSVYERAGIDAASCGMGYFRVLTDYVDSDSFDQEILIKSIPNPFSVYFDPDASLPTREDARWCFITEPMSKKDFEKAYPGKKIDPVETDSADAMEHWRDSDDVVVAEYFWLEAYEVAISQLPDGRVVEGKFEGAPSRTATRNRVMWAKISGAEVLEGPVEWSGKYIPIIAVMGEELHVGDRVFRSSVIRHAKDPQRLYNYWRSAQTELVALQPKAPFLVTADQIKGLEKFWAGANTENRPYLPFNVDNKAPGLVPQRQNPPMPSAGMMQEIGIADGDMKATTGIYDSSLGERSNEASGVAIRQRQMESDVSTSVYSDHVGKAVERCGRIIVDLIPRVYDTTRQVRILGKDDAQQLVEVNRPMLGPEGPTIRNDLRSGRYDVRVSVGPNYATKRQETVQSLMEFVKAFPARAPSLAT